MNDSEVDIKSQMCQCESSLCHGCDKAGCGRHADPRFWCMYIGYICDVCASNMGATGGQEFLFLREVVGR